MNAVILAAGLGKRLGKEGHTQPKCLLSFNGKSLLERHLDYLNRCQVKEVTIVVGYQAEKIQDEIKALGVEAWVKTIHNPDYTQGSVVSLWVACPAISGQNDLLLMDADILYDHRIINQLVKTGISNCFLLDRDFEPGAEPVKLCVRDGGLVEFRKQLAPDLVYDMVGESVGFFRFGSATAQRLVDRTAFYITNGRRAEPYEEAIRELLLEAPTAFGYEDITGLAWVEIDFPEDIQRAQAQILPRLEVIPV